mmetsp:Transcript_10647/g.14747  ORF Transcript_10647/g.14747 Transcript_10647/m.14747 type:complete len:137 (+) Transcript_10647:95-505(+)
MINEGETDEIVEEEFVQVGYEDAMPEGSYEVVDIMSADGRKQSILVAKEDAVTPLDAGDQKSEEVGGGENQTPSSSAALERIGDHNEQREIKGATTIGGEDAANGLASDAGEQSPSEEDIGFAEQKSLLPTKQPAE